jgi:hypothetical protein
MFPKNGTFVPQRPPGWTWFFSYATFIVAKFLKLTPAKGCRTGPPGNIDWWAGATTLCRSQIYPSVRDLESCYTNAFVLAIVYTYFSILNLKLSQCYGCESDLFCQVGSGIIWIRDRTQFSWHLISYEIIIQYFTFILYIDQNRNVKFRKEVRVQL